MLQLKQKHNNLHRVHFQFKFEHVIQDGRVVTQSPFAHSAILSFCRCVRPRSSPPQSKSKPQGRPKKGLQSLEEIKQGNNSNHHRHGNNNHDFSHIQVMTSCSKRVVSTPPGMEARQTKIAQARARDQNQSEKAYRQKLKKMTKARRVGKGHSAVPALHKSKTG